MGSDDGRAAVLEVGRSVVVTKVPKVEAYIVLLYMFLMMFFRFVYLFYDCLVLSILSMFEHPSSQSLGLRIHLCHVHYSLT